MLDAKQKSSYTEGMNKLPLATRVQILSMLVEGSSLRSISRVAEWVSRRRPGIHMPRWASRMTLVVTEVRVEKLQEISEADAKVEAAPWYVGGHGVITEEEYRAEPGYQPSKRAGFEFLWNEIHGWNPPAWAMNPWVAAVSFEVHRGNVDLCW